MIATFKNSFKIREVRTKILWTLFLVLIYRLGAFIPIPGINIDQIASVVQGSGTILDILNAITGGALRNGTLFAVGISPYINASIIMQLLTVAVPTLERWSKEGEEGREKINKITRYVTVALAIVSSVGIIVAFNGAGVLDVGLFKHTDMVVPTWLVFIFSVLVLTAGSSLCMYLGERITQYGVSNGISMLIFAGIISTFGTAIITNVRAAVSSPNGFMANGGWEMSVFLVLIIAIFGFIVFIDKGERRIPVQYAKQIKGNRMYGGQSTHIPIKVNASGVLPLIFAMALLSLPSIIISTFFSGSGADGWLQDNFSGNSAIYAVVMSILILAFAYFYSQISFNPVDVAKNLQQNGGFILGIRPGKPTADHLNKIVKRITLYGALFLAFIALVPTLLSLVIPDSKTNLYNAMSATGMMIVVSVALEFNKALEQQIMLRHYKGFLK